MSATATTSPVKPYFETAGAASGARRLLLITYHFPPDPAVGGIRWQQMTRHLAENGWRADVVCRDFSQMSGVDLERLEALAPGIRLFTVSDCEPLVGRFHGRLWPLLKKVLRRQRKSQGAPASDVIATLPKRPHALGRMYLTYLQHAREAMWSRRAVQAALSLMKTEDYRLIISSGPPHMAHIAGLRVHYQGALPWIVDMRDPWSLSERVSDYVSGALWFALARKYERLLPKAASLILMNTEASRDAMRRRYPQFAERIITVRNGADGNVIPASRRDGVFRLRFAGSIYIDRDPRLVFRAAAMVVKELELRPHQFLLEFVGHVESYGGLPVKEIARQEGIPEFVRVGDRLSRKQTLEFLAGATMLLSLPQDNHLAIPAKIYEYVMVDAWMLVLAEPQSSTARLLLNSGADVVEPSNVEQIASAIKRRYEELAQGVVPRAVGSGGQFDRRVQTDILRLQIDRILQAETRAQRASR